MLQRILLVTLVVGNWACSGRENPASPAVPSPIVTAAPTARYRVTFDATWSASTHPSETPRVPHFSGLIGATHREPQRFWEAGALATEGIRAMAEMGRKTPLDQEVVAAIAAGGAQHLLSGGSIDLSPATVALDFEISRDYPLVTLVSMVAPSPDWFVGVSGASLLDGGDWVPERVVSLRPWDAGTDSGVTFESRDRATVPREPIARITTGPLVVGADVPPMGTFTFRRLP
jgi:hypothetical protein